MSLSKPSRPLGIFFAPFKYFGPATPGSTQGQIAACCLVCHKYGPLADVNTDFINFQAPYECVYCKRYRCDLFMNMDTLVASQIWPDPLPDEAYLNPWDYFCKNLVFWVPYFKPIYEEMTNAKGGLKGLTFRTTLTETKFKGGKKTINLINLKSSANSNTVNLSFCYKEISQNLPIDSEFCNWREEIESDPYFGPAVLRGYGGSNRGAENPINNYLTINVFKTLPANCFTFYQGKCNSLNKREAVLYLFVIYLIFIFFSGVGTSVICLFFFKALFAA